MEVGNPRINSTASSLEFLYASHPRIRLFLDRFRQRTSEETLQILQERGRFPRSAGIHHDGPLSAPRREDPRRRAPRHDLLGRRPLLVLLQASRSLLRFFRSRSAERKTAVKLLPTAEDRTGRERKFQSLEPVDSRNDDGEIARGIMENPTESTKRFVPKIRGYTVRPKDHVETTQGYPFLPFILHRYTDGDSYVPCRRLICNEKNCV